MYKTEHKIGALATGLFSLVIYLLTVAPTVTFWDAGEFMAASYTLGIPHAPGTPLFMLIGRVISLLPLGLSVAFKLNLVSVLCGAVTSGMLYLIAAHVLENASDGGPGSRFVVHGGAFCAGAIVTGLRTVWLNTTEFEVYGLATATFALVTWLMVYMGTTKDFRKTQRILLLVIYIISLSVANHLLVLLAAPAVAIFTILHDKKHRNYWFSVLGLLAGIYLVVSKGFDLGLVAATVSSHTEATTGLAGGLVAAVSGLLEVLSQPNDHLASDVSFVVGVLLLASCGWWGWKEKSLVFFATAIGLFLLGFSVHLFLPLRAALNPSINMGDPDTLRTFWAVIGREQYGSSYGIFPRQVWTLLTGKIEMSGAADLMENIKFFFMYNLPFYNKYLGWQFGTKWLTAGFLVLAVYGAVRHFLSARNTFWLCLTVFMLTGPILNLYMNFQFGHSQFPEVQLHPAVSNMRLREPRERDYFFIVSFAFIGFWAAIGLAAAANKLVKTVSELLNRPLTSTVVAVVFLPLLLPAFLPIAMNWEHADRSGNYIPQSFARNILNSMPPNSILFTNGDNDTFPMWYAQEVEGIRKDIRVVNLSLLNLPWYIRQMRDEEPTVPITLPDERIDSLRPFRSDQEIKFPAGEMEINYPAGTVFYVKDVIVLDILRSNNWRRPLYYVTSVPAHNRTGLDPHYVLEGLVFRVTEKTAYEVAAADTNIVPLRNHDSTAVNVSRTWELLTEQYDYNTFFRPGDSGESENKMAVKRFAVASSRLTMALEVLGDYERALVATQMSRRFMDGDRRYYNPVMARYLANLGRFDEAVATLDSVASALPPGNLINHFLILSQIAANKQDFDKAIELMHQSLEIDSTSKLTYGNLFYLLNALNRRDEAVEAIQTYLKHRPDDTTVAAELERYRNGGNFDLGRTFGLRH